MNLVQETYTPYRVPVFQFRVLFGDWQEVADWDEAAVQDYLKTMFRFPYEVAVSRDWLDKCWRVIVKRMGSKDGDGNEVRSDLAEALHILSKARRWPLAIPDMEA